MTKNSPPTIILNPSRSGSSSLLKALVASTPVLGALARSVACIPVVQDLRRRFGFQGSSSYWEKRYRQGGSSGSGSFGRLAEFKAKILNDYVERNNVKSVIEFGCGDGAQLSLAQYPRYVGVDITEGAISACRQRFASDDTKSFYLVSEVPSDLGRFDLVVSLDVIYHLVEDEVYFTYMRSLFAHAGRVVAIYSSNKVSSSDAPHVRHRRFTHWIKVNEPHWRETAYCPNIFPYNPERPGDTSFAEFYFFEMRGPEPC